MAGINLLKPKKKPKGIPKQRTQTAIPMTAFASKDCRYISGEIDATTPIKIKTKPLKILDENLCSFRIAVVSNFFFS